MKILSKGLYTFQSENWYNTKKGILKSKKNWMTLQVLKILQFIYPCKIKQEI